MVFHLLLIFIHDLIFCISNFLILIFFFGRFLVSFTRLSLLLLCLLLVKNCAYCMHLFGEVFECGFYPAFILALERVLKILNSLFYLSLIHISEPTRLGMISYAV